MPSDYPTADWCWDEYAIRASVAAYLFDQRECEWWPNGWLNLSDWKWFDAKHR